MARIRTIKPDFWSSEDITAVCRDARLLFIGLWTFADDAGNGPASPKELKMKVFPGDADVKPTKIEKWLNDLSTELIALYEVKGKQYYHVTGWHHQLINNPSKEKYPAFSEESRRATVGLSPLRDVEEDRIGKDSAISTAQVYVTFKKRRMDGAHLEAFDLFWDAFDYKKDRAKAADAWLGVQWPDDSEAKNELFAKIIKAAKSEASDRGFLFEQRKTPIYPEGWLSHRRWEDA